MRLLLNAPARLSPTLRASQFGSLSSYPLPSPSLIPSEKHCSLNSSAGSPRPYTRLFPTNRHPLLSPKPDPADILDPSRPHRARHRLGLFASHLANTQKPVLELNTPFSVERASSAQDHAAIIADESRKILEAQTIKTLKELDKQDKKQTIEEEAVQKKPPSMSKQEPHATVLIPGPIEFDDAVLQSMSHFSESHVGMPFVHIFGESLSMLRKLFITSNPASQPFLIAGSGTLGWDQIASNLTEPGDNVLVLHTGYFADSFADCFEVYGVNAVQLKAPIGDRPQQDEVEKALKENKYKMITITHVDTSTGVLSDIKALSELVHRVSPETLVVVDGVCSAGSEEIRFDEWGLDVVMTASQKGIGCPAGLSILMASERAVETFKTRKHRPTSYFASWKNWMPSMHFLVHMSSYFANPWLQLCKTTKQRSLPTLPHHLLSSSVLYTLH